MAPPAAKKAKTEASALAKKEETTLQPEEKEVAPITEEPKEAKLEQEAPKELEQDAGLAKKPLVEPVVFHGHDTTMNLMPSTVGGLLKPLTEGSMQQLLAGARGSAGVISGRYMFEVKIIETIGKSPVLKVGFSTAAADLLIGEGMESVCFESDGTFAAEGKRGPCVKTKSWGRDATIAVLLNLDKKSPNSNTVSLFMNGHRSCQPQALPEALHGKALFPAVTFRGMTLHVNFAEEPLEPLPFQCRMIGAAEQADVEIASTPDKPKDGKYEVLCPVGLPDEGLFDWLDMFLKKNKKYTEVSDRAIQSWCEKSGITKKGQSASSLDKPSSSSEVTSITTMLRNILPLQQRDIIIMELKANLIKESRMNAVQPFPNSIFKKIAMVVVGEPTSDFRKYTLALVRQDRQEELNKKFKLDFQVEKAKWQQAQRQKEAEKKKKEAEKVRKKALDAQKKKMAELQAKRDAEKKPKEAGETVVENGEAAEENKENKEEEKLLETGEMDEEAEEVVVEEPEPVMGEPPIYTLTDEDKKIKFRTKSTPDLSPQAFNTSFQKFSVPTKDEGFDTIRYQWSPDAECEAYIKKYVLAKKNTTRVEDLKPSQWFKEKKLQWDKAFGEYKSKQNEWKSIVTKKEVDKKKKLAEKAKKAAAAKAAALQKEADKKKKEEVEARQTAETGEAPKEVEEEKDEPEPAEAEEVEEAEEDDNTVDFENIDIFGLDDINDIGKGMPLCKDFMPEDWTLANLRVELSLLVHAFKHDVDDEERLGIHIEHLPFYYQKYYSKQLTPNNFGVDSIEGLLSLIPDTMYISAHQVLETPLPDDYESMGIFVKLVEEARRTRNLMLDTGDENARLKLPAAASLVVGSASNQAGAQTQTHTGGKGGGKSWGKGWGGGGKRGGGGNRSQPYRKW